MKPGSEVLAYTPTYHDRDGIAATVKAFRAAAGYWFDWAVFAGAPSPELQETLTGLLNHPQKLGIQYLRVWPENRGQHHATAEALWIARQQGYKWLWRIDDDVMPKTKRLLKKMLERAEHIKKVAKDPRYRFVVGPTVKGLRNQIPAVAVLDNPKDARATIVPVMGGACRLHPLELLEGYEAPLFEPVGRGDPDSISEFVASRQGAILRFEDIRVVHKTDELEKKETPAQAHARRMGWYWPYLGAGV